MLISKIMQRDVVTAGPSAPIQEVARKMFEQKIGSVLITDEKGQLQGIVTDRDIAMAVGAECRDPKETFASEIMTRDLLTMEFDSDLESALQTMNQAHTRRLPVTEKGRLTGIISSADVAGALKVQLDQFMGLEETYASH